MYGFAALKDVFNHKFLLVSCDGTLPS